jgi:hypothetical protein
LSPGLVTHVEVEMLDPESPTFNTRRWARSRSVKTKQWLVVRNHCEFGIAAQVMVELKAAKLDAESFSFQLAVSALYITK